VQINEITFVIVTFHSEEIIFDCLDLLPNESKKIIIENSKNMELKSKLESRYTNLTCHLMDQNLGYGKANNIGINLSETEFVFILNPDVRFSSNNFNKFLQILSNEEFTIAAPVEKDEFSENLNKKNVTEVNFVKGFAMLLNKNLLRNDYFDENIFLYLEEIDLCKRVKKNSGRILRVNVPIVHLGGASHGDKENIEMEKSRNWHWMWSKFYYKKKYKGYFIGLILTLPSFFTSFVKYLFYSLTKNKIKKNIYRMRFLGLLNSYLLKKSFYRPKLI
jgi:GT2 family glycosyltransferase